MSNIHIRVLFKGTMGTIRSSPVRDEWLHEAEFTNFRGMFFHPFQESSNNNDRKSPSNIPSNIHLTFLTYRCFFWVFVFLHIVAAGGHHRLSSGPLRVPLGCLADDRLGAAVWGATAAMSSSTIWI